MKLNCHLNVLVSLVAATLLFAACSKSAPHQKAAPRAAATKAAPIAKAAPAPAAPAPAAPAPAAAAPAGDPVGVAAVTVPAKGINFDPPIDIARLPVEAWYCTMGKSHYARMEKGDGVCPRCHMKLHHKTAK